MKLLLVMRGGMQVSMERDLHISSPLRMASHLGGEREKQKSFQTSIHPPPQFLYCPAGILLYFIYIFFPPRKAFNYCYVHTMEGSHTQCLAVGKPTGSRIFTDMKEYPTDLPAAYIFTTFFSMFKCLLPLLQSSFLPNLEFPCFLTPMLCSPILQPSSIAGHPTTMVGFDSLSASDMVMSPISCVQGRWGHIVWGSPAGPCFLTLARYSITQSSTETHSTTQQ